MQCCLASVQQFKKARLQRSDVPRKNKGKTLCSWLVFTQLFRTSNKERSFLSLSLIRSLDYMYLCVLEKMTTLRAWTEAKALSQLHVLEFWTYLNLVNPKIGRRVVNDKISVLYVICVRFFTLRLFLIWVLIFAFIIYHFMSYWKDIYKLSVCR